MKTIYSSVELAERFATIAHQGQVRKYTDEPYINHPIAVNELLVEHSANLSRSMNMAALLHDTVEDTEVNLHDIRNFFGSEVEELVYWLTDISRPSDGNRAKRKLIDRDHIENAPRAAKTIKLADLIDNSRSIVKHDPGFAKVYMKEKLLLLNVLFDENCKLFGLASDLVDGYYRGLK